MASRDVPPGGAVADLVDTRDAHAELSRQGLTIFIATGADLPHLIFRYYRSVVFFAALSNGELAATAICVLHVLALGSSSKMRRVAARRVVTTVQYIKPVRYGPIGKCERDTMSSLRHQPADDSAIPMVVLLLSPWPACVRAARAINARPEDALEPQPLGWRVDAFRPERGDGMIRLPIQERQHLSC